MTILCVVVLQLPSLELGQHQKKDFKEVTVFQLPKKLVPVRKLHVKPDTTMSETTDTEFLEQRSKEVTNCSIEFAPERQSKLKPDALDFP